MCNHHSAPNPFYLLRSILLRRGQDYLDQYEPLPSHIKAMEGIVKCGTESMGKGYEEPCSCCDGTHVVYHRCNNRACPRCHWIKKKKWCRKMENKLPCCSYSFVTVKIPTVLHDVFYRNQKLMYDLLLKSVSLAVKEFVDQRFGGLPAIIATLQTCNHRLDYNPHVHCLVSNGWMQNGKWVEPRNPYWIPTMQVLERIKEKFLNLLWKERRATFRFIEKHIRKSRWEIDCKPFGSEQKYVADENGNERWELDHATNLRKAVKYMSRNCLAGHRIIDTDNDNVTIKYDDHGRQVTELIDGVEYIRRFMRHVLPKGIHSVREYGLLQKPAELKKAKKLLAMKYKESGNFIDQWLENSEPFLNEELNETYGKCCPHCGNRTLKSMRVFFEDFQRRKQHFFYGGRASPNIPDLNVTWP